MNNLSLTDFLKLTLSEARIDALEKIQEVVTHSRLHAALSSYKDHLNTKVVQPAKLRKDVYTWFTEQNYALIPHGEGFVGILHGSLVPRCMIHISITSFQTTAVKGREEGDFGIMACGDYDEVVKALEFKSELFTQKAN